MVRQAASRVSGSVTYSNNDVITGPSETARAEACEPGDPVGDCSCALKGTR